MKSARVRITTTLPGKPEIVFGALTHPKEIKRWSGQKGKMEMKAGGKFEMFDGWVKGRVVQFDPAKSLVHTWRPADWPEEAAESVVKYTFRRTKKGTKVVLIHSDFPNETERKSHENGWKEFVIDPLKEYLSTRTQARSEAE